jgi:hypothetical protein
MPGWVERVAEVLVYALAGVAIAGLVVIAGIVLYGQFRLWRWRRVQRGPR